MKAPNNIFQDIINRLTYWLTTISTTSKDKKLAPNEHQTPLWITGLFRSGTSITARLVNEMGISLSPEEDLLQAKGSRRTLNPDGFFENYVFMEWSLYLFHQLDSWGDLPPSIESVENFNYNTILHKKFIYNAIVSNHDDRISNISKYSLLRNFHPHNLDTYLHTKFSNLFAIKNPHFMLLHPILDRYWPNGNYLIVFRNPQDNILSAKKVSPRVNIQLYYDYYSRLIHHPRAIFFDYDTLLKHPEKSIQQLALKLNISSEFSHLATLINAKSSTSKDKITLPMKVANIYSELQEKAINNRS